MQTKKKRWLVTILLLFIVVVTAFLLKQNGYSKEIPLTFKLQDSTTIPPGNIGLKIWDYGTIDSDIVNIIFNGKPIFKNLLLSDTPVVYQPGFLGKGRYWIGVEAISQGILGSASPHISLNSGQQKFEFNIDSYKNKPAYQLIIVQ